MAGERTAERTKSTRRSQPGGLDDGSSDDGHCECLFVDVVTCDMSSKLERLSVVVCSCCEASSAPGAIWFMLYDLIMTADLQNPGVHNLSGS